MADNLDPNTLEQLNRAFEELAKTSEGLGGTLSKNDTQYHNTGVSAEKVGKHFDSLVKKLDAVNKRLDETNKKDKKHTDKKEEEAKAVDKLKERTGIASQALDEFAKKHGALGKTIKESITHFEKIADVRTRMAEISKVLGSANLVIEESGDIMELHTAQMKKDMIALERSIAKKKYWDESLFTSTGRMIQWNKEVTRSQKAIQELASAEGLGKLLSDAATKTGGFLKGLAQGQTSFTTLNPVIDLVANSLGSVLKAVPIFGEALNGLTKAAADASKFMIEQVQGALKDFQDVAKFGGLVADGMTGLQRQFIESGMTMEGYKKVIKENADTMASFGGTVGKGSERFSKMVGGLTTKGGAFENLGDELRKLGMTSDEIGESAAMYLEQEIKLGRARNKTDAQLTEGAAQYAKELDALQKLTGQSKEALQKQQDALNADVRFRAVLQEEEAKGNKKGAEAMANVLKVLGPDSQVGVAIKTFGAEMGMTTEESRKAALTYGDEFRQRVEDLKHRRITEDEFLQAYTKMAKSANAAGSSISQVGKILGKDSPYLDMAQQLDNANKLEGKSFAEAMKAQKGQIDSTDETTKKTIEAQKSMENMSRTMKNLAFQFLPQAATAINNLTDSLDDLVDWIAETTGKDIGTPEQKAARQAKKDIKKLEQELATAEQGRQVVDIMGNQTGQVEYDQELINKIKAQLEAKQLGLTSSKAAQRVDMSSRAPSEPGAAGNMDNLMKKIINVESGGKANAQAKTSSAFGLGQFTKGTFESLAKRKDSAVFGKSWEDYKTDPNLQIAALQDLIKINQDQLQKNKIQVTDSATYLAHFLGAAGATKVLKATNETDIKSLVDENAYKANQKIFDQAKTVGGLKMWAAKKMGEDVNVALGQGAPQARYEGIFDGPESGYMAVLHGREQVTRVPNTDGVKLGGVAQSTLPSVTQTSNNSELMGVFTALIDKIDNLVSLTKETNRTLDQQLTYAKA